MKIRKHNEVDTMDLSKLPEQLQINIPKGCTPLNLESMFHTSMMDTFGLTSEQYDYLCDFITDDELSKVFLVFDNKDRSFSTKREVLTIVNKYKKLSDDKQ